MLSHSNSKAAVRALLAVAMSVGRASSARADHTRSTCGVTVSVGTPTLSLSYSTVPRVTRVYTSSSYHPYGYSAAPVVSSYRTSGYSTGYVVKPKVVVSTTHHSQHPVLRSTTSRIYPTSSRIYSTSSRIYPTSSRIYSTSSRIYPTSSRIHSTSSRIYPTTSTHYHGRSYSTPRISVVFGSSRAVHIPTHGHGVSVSSLGHSLHRSGHH